MNAEGGRIRTEGLVGGRSFSSGNRFAALGALAPEAGTRATAHPPEEIAAFFDLDGTLIPRPSLEWRFVSYLLSRDEIPSSNLVRWLARSITGFFGGPWGSVRAIKSYLAGLRAALACDWERSLLLGSLPVFSAGLDRLRWHAAQGHCVFLVSGTLEPLARIVARRLEQLLPQDVAPQIKTCATRLESFGGIWTGFLTGEHMCGEAKARAIREIAAAGRFDLSRSFAYGDEIADIPMLAAVGHPVAVNPSSRLERAARVHGWRICDWRKLEGAPLAMPGIPRNAFPRTFSPRAIP